MTVRKARRNLNNGTRDQGACREEGTPETNTTGSGGVVHRGAFW